MKNSKILIVEDEILIADTIKKYLVLNKYSVVGTVISFTEAIDLVKKNPPDLVLIDIILNGQKSGIDLAKYLRNHYPKIPFLFISSQTDRLYMEALKKTNPDGFLTKPIRKDSLLAMIEVILFNHKDIPEDTILIRDNESSQNVKLDNITYIMAEHVYIRIYLLSGKMLLIRKSLRDISDELPEQFIRVHRSYIVNKKHIKKWNKNSLKIQNVEVPISRSKKKQVHNLLELQT